MKPDDLRPTTPIVVPQRQSATQVTGDARDSFAQQEAAGNVVRSQINSIYDTQAYQDAQQPDSPYDRNYSQSEREIQQSMWQRYHSAWQDYYQKYYERYYIGQIHEVKQSLEAEIAAKNRVTQPQFDATEPPITKDEAMYDLRSKLLSTVQDRATKVRKSRHFVPVAAALTIMLVFLLLQYNRVIVANVEAYMSPGTIDQQNLIVDPNVSEKVDPTPKIIIPKINVDIPIIWDAVASSQDSLNQAMNYGAAWFNIPGANSRPGQIGNSVYSAHSSNDWIDQGDYKFAFARLEQLKVGDTIYINYESTRYTYSVTHTKVVKPTDVHELTDPVDKPIMTLITCVPLGTALNRLLVFADQVSPAPSSAIAKPETTANAKPAAMPSNSPTFLERVFGGN